MSLKQRWMWVVWPAFLAAAILEMLVFAFVDPSDLHFRGELLGWTPRAVYTLCFFTFWLLTLLSSLLTALLSVSSDQINTAVLADRDEW